MYLLIMADNDYRVCKFLSEQDLAELLQFPEAWDVERFLSVLPAEEDPRFWEGGSALLMKADIVVPERQVSWMIPVEVDVQLPPVRSSVATAYRSKASGLRMTYDDVPLPNLLPKLRIVEEVPGLAPVEAVSHLREGEFVADQEPVLLVPADDAPVSPAVLAKTDEALEDDDTWVSRSRPVRVADDGVTFLSGPLDIPSKVE